LCDPAHVIRLLRSGWTPARPVTRRGRGEPTSDPEPCQHPRLPPPRRGPPGAPPEARTEPRSRRHLQRVRGRGRARRQRL